MAKRRVVITGMGAVTPLGHNVSKSWEAVRAGECGIAPISLFDASDMKVSLAAEVKEWDPAATLGARESKHLARFTQFALAAAREAMDDSGLALDADKADRAGVIIGSGIGGVAETESQQMRCSARGYDRCSPYYIPSGISNMAAGQVAIAFGFKGMCTCPVTACASGTNAVGDAFRQIRDGYADVMLAGGTEAAITPLSIGGFTTMRALHTGDDPTCASIPFDARRSGFVMGEGAGVCLLEELEHAQARGAHVYAELVGYGVTCDAFHITAPSENGEGAARAMQLTLEDAGVDPSRVGYINAHGTSTKLNDERETQAIKTVFGEYAQELAVSSTKSMTGHMLGAAGAVEAIFTALALRDSYLPATIGCEEPDSACDLDYVTGEGRSASLSYAMSNSLGFGGHNACILMKAWEG